MQVRVSPSKVFVVVWVALQLALPMAWYLGDDPYDERFSWRMFSEVRLVRCEVAFAVAGEPVSLQRRFHVAWVRLAERARPSVLRAMTAELCEDGAPVTLKLTCRHADRSRVTVHDGTRDRCAAETPDGG